MSNSECRMTKVDAVVGYHVDLIEALINSKFFGRRGPEKYTLRN
jgi:hypothetical protein